MNTDKRNTYRAIALVCCLLLIACGRWFGTVDANKKFSFFTKKSNHACCGHHGAHVSKGVAPKSIDWSSVSQVDNLVPVLVIGTGSAGMVAANYCARNGMRVVALEGLTPGGALTQTTMIDNWPGRGQVMGNALMDDIRAQAEKHGVIFVADSAQSVDFKQWPFKVTTVGKKVFHALSVLVMTGATPKRLGIPGEDTYWGKGVTTCALCDGPFFKGKAVVVVGGGDAALEEAMQAATFAKEVTILVRSGAFRASAPMQKRIKDFKNINVRFNVQITQISGNGDIVTGITLKTATETMEMPVSGVFIAIGQNPNTALFNHQIKLDSQGYITLPKGRSQATSVDGIFAAGDSVDYEYRQAGVAAGDAIKASIDVQRWLQQMGYVSQKADELKNLFSLKQEIVRSGGSEVQEIKTEAEFEAIRASGAGLVVVDFYTDNCPVCKTIKPLIIQMAQKYSEKIRFYELNMTRFPTFAEKYKGLNVVHAPTIIAFNNGALAGRYDKGITRQGLEKMLDHLNGE